MIDDDEPTSPAISAMELLANFITAIGISLVLVFGLHLGAELIFGAIE